MNEVKEDTLAVFHAAFKRLNEAKEIRDRVARMLAHHDNLVNAAEEEVDALRKKHGIDRKDRATKDEMIAIRAKLRIALRDAQGEPMLPSQVAEDAELKDLDQVRRVLRDMAALPGPVKNIQESRKESRYYWDATWRPSDTK